MGRARHLNEVSIQRNKFEKELTPGIARTEKKEVVTTQRLAGMMEHLLEDAYLFLEVHVDDNKGEPFCFVYYGEGGLAETSERGGCIYDGEGVLRLMVEDHPSSYWTVKSFDLKI